MNRQEIINEWKQWLKDHPEAKVNTVPDEWLEEEDWDEIFSQSQE